MPDERQELSRSAAEVEAGLGTLRPAPPAINRDALMFRAGQLAAGRKGRAWRPAAVVLLVAAVAGGWALRGLGGGSVPSGGNSGSGQFAGVPAQFRIDELQGMVLVKHEGRSTWEQLAPVGSRLFVGDTLLCSRDASVVLKLADESRVILAGSSMLTLTHQDGGTELALAQGTVTADLTSPHPPFVISTPQGRVHALGTTFTVTARGKD